MMLELFKDHSSYSSRFLASLKSYLVLFLEVFEGILSEKRKSLKIQIINSKEDKRAERKKQRRNLKKEIDVKLKEKEDRELDHKMEPNEKIKDDNCKYHYIMRDLNKPKQKIHILVKNQEGEIPGTTQEKIKIIEEYFVKTLAPQEMKDL